MKMCQAGALILIERLTSVSFRLRITNVSTKGLITGIIIIPIYYIHVSDGQPMYPLACVSKRFLERGKTSSHIYEYSNTMCMQLAYCYN